MTNFEQSNIVVTGSASGIGLAITLTLAGEQQYGQWIFQNIRRMRSNH